MVWCNSHLTYDFFNTANLKYLQMVIIYSFILYHALLLDTMASFIIALEPTFVFQKNIYTLDITEK